MRTKLVFIAMTALMLASCNKVADKVNEQEDSVPEKEAVAVKELPVSYAPAGSFGTLSDAVKGILMKQWDFSFGLLSGMYEEGESLIVSPLSVQFALGMLYAGADGQTAAEIADVIGTGENMTKEAMLSYGKTVMEGLAGDDAVTARIANALVVNSAQTSVKREYASNLLSNFYAPSIDADFNEEADDILKGVNDWSNKVTEGRIPFLLDRINPEVGYYLFSSLYLKGEWNLPMVESTGKFIHADGKEETIPTLHTSDGIVGGSGFETLSYAQKEGYQLVRRGLGRENYAFYVVLPTGSSLAAVLESVKKNPTAVFQDMKAGPVWMSMPAISQKGDVDLKDVLGKLGIEKVFSSGSDLSQMFERNSKVGQIYQKSSFEVNVLGLEGASVTVVDGPCLSPEPGTEVPEPFFFIADHSFLYFVREETTGLILYIGVYE